MLDWVSSPDYSADSLVFCAPQCMSAQWSVLCCAAVGGRWAGWAPSPRPRARHASWVPQQLDVTRHNCTLERATRRLSAIPTPFFWKFAVGYILSWKTNKTHPQSTLKLRYVLIIDFIMLSVKSLQEYDTQLFISIQKRCRLLLHAWQYCAIRLLLGITLFWRTFQWVWSSFQ